MRFGRLDIRDIKEIVRDCFTFSSAVDGYPQGPIRGSERETEEIDSNQKGEVQAKQE